MKKIYLLLIFSIFWNLGFTQLNMSLLSQVSYEVSLNDVWGWAAPDGTEYALVGVRNGLSIVSLADPEDAQEVAFIPGQNTTWRDIKTWGNFAYVTSDNTSEGLLVVDLSQLPDAAPYFYWAPELDGLGTLRSCHNLYIDEFGYAYLAGCNINSGGMLFIDVFSNPGNPVFVGPAPAIYSHDVYVRDNRMYASEIYLGRAAIYDVADKANPALLGAATTPFEFTHNIWLSDDGNVMFTTDERPNAPIGAYDISDPSNIIELDQFKPIETLGADVIPHNVHVWNDWLIISYYTDGGIIVDASRPSNLIEVGNFDTFLGVNGGFNGAWGAYPFLPSGIVLVSDIGNGLYVLDADYVRACWLEGVVTDAQTGALLNGVEVTINSSQANLGQTNALGAYETGQAIPGTFDVLFEKPGYMPKTVQAILQNGEVTILNVELTPLASYNLAGQTIRDADGNPIPGARVLVVNDDLSYDSVTDSEGAFSIAGVIEGTYDIFVGAWGYLHQMAENVDVATAEPMVFALEEGYQDDFILDFEWETQASASTSSGFWVREVPIGTVFNNQFANPPADIAGDFGDMCYVTGNAGGGAGTDDVDGGSVTLISPVMDLSNYNEPLVSYYTWFFNSGGNGNPDDELTVSVTNGNTTVELEQITQSGSAWRPKSEFNLGQFIEITDQMQIIFTTSDFEPTGHLVEAAVDAFRVIDLMPNSTTPVEMNAASLMAFPNPFSDRITVDYEIPGQFDNAFVTVYNGIGQQMLSIAIADEKGRIDLGDALVPGVYFIRIEADGKAGQAVKVIKIK